MSVNLNAIKAQVQARMNAVDGSTPETQLAVLNKLCAYLVSKGQSMDRTAFDLALANRLTGVDGDTGSIDMAKLMASIEDESLGQRRKTERWTAPGAHSFTVPNGVYVIWVSGCAGGGGGAGSVGSNANPGDWSGGGGGGGASCTRLPFFVSPGEVLSLNVGTGGVGGVGGSNANRGDHGGSSSVTGQLDSILLPGGERGESSLAVPKGGKFAVDGSAHLVSGGNGGTGAQFNQVPVNAEGTYRFAGGVSGNRYVYVYQGGGGGGASYFGGGGNGGSESTDKNGQPGGVGAGGGGAHRGASGQNFNGAAGGNGLIVLEY